MLLFTDPLGKKMIAPLSFEGYTDAAVFNHWLEHCLVPELPPKHTIIIDNASFHKSTRTQQIIEAAGCNIIFLPSYSPDLNPIEKWWAILKKHIRKALKTTKNLSRAIQIAFQNMQYHKNYINLKILYHPHRCRKHALELFVFLHQMHPLLMQNPLPRGLSLRKG